MEIVYSEDEKKNIINEIQTFFSEEFEEQIGEIRAANILEFFMEKMGNQIYKKGIEDSKKWMQEKLDDLEVDLG